MEDSISFLVYNTSKKAGAKGQEDRNELYLMDMAS